MTDQLRDRLAAELAACGTATPGPWEFEPDRTMRDGVYPAYVFVEHMAGYPICDVTSSHIPAGDEDAEFIAAARTGYPLALRALQAVMELEDESISGTMMGHEIDQAYGYNEALRDVREAIREVYGGDNSS